MPFATINYSHHSLDVEYTHTPEEPEFFNHKEGYGHPGADASWEIHSVCLSGEDITDLLGKKQLKEIKERLGEDYEELRSSVKITFKRFPQIGQVRIAKEAEDVSNADSCQSCAFREETCINFHCDVGMHYEKVKPK